MDYKIRFIWDDEAAVWIASSDDVPGLVLESGSFDALVEKVRFAVPELLKLNTRATDQYGLTFLAERHDQVFANG